MVWKPEKKNAKREEKTTTTTCRITLKMRGFSHSRKTRETEQVDKSRLNVFNQVKPSLLDVNWFEFELKILNLIEFESSSSFKIQIEFEF